MRLLCGLFVAVVLCLIPLYSSVASLLSERTVEEKLGYIPSNVALRIMSLEHRHLTSEWLFLRAVTYYGGQIEKKSDGTTRAIQYPEMYEFLNAAALLDACNADVHYFAQAIFPWELGKAAETNEILAKGLSCRTWDPFIPFFLGFNSYYFLKDYKSAATYFHRAAVISGDVLAVNLTARSLYEADETRMAIGFLKLMIEKANNETVRSQLQMRLDTLNTILVIEDAVRQFEDIKSQKPALLQDLIAAGLIRELPRDPYGGRFYLENGRVRTTSKLALGGSRGHRD